MTKLDKKIINEIAQNIGMGCDCYFHIETKEIIALPIHLMMEDEEEFNKLFAEDLKLIKKQKKYILKFEALKSSESFEIMEYFAEQISEDKFRIEVQNVLNRKKPFQNFKHLVESSELRQNWFDFRQNELEKLVKNLLE